MKLSLVLLAILLNISVYSQNAEYSRFIFIADSLYKGGDYKNSAMEYSKAFQTLGWKGYSNDRYNAACSWALANEIDSAFFQLNILATKTKYKNYEHISSDEDLSNLRSDERWNTLLAQIKSNKEESEKNLDKELAAILDSVYYYDQYGRKQIKEVEAKYGLDSEQYKVLWKMIVEKDSLNLIAVKNILDTRGWLGEDVVGERGNSALFLVIQHAEISTQEKYLPMMREAVRNGKANAASLALLEDRVALRQGKKQIYGSQVNRDLKTNYYYVAPLDDPDNVDKRRAEVGLQPLSAYLLNWDIKWDVEKYKKDLPVIMSTWKTPN